MAFSVIETDADHIKGLIDSLLVMVWVRHTELSAYRRGIELVRHLSVQFPRGVGVCNVVEPSAEPPDARTRSEFVAMLRMPEIQHFSVLHEGAGFKAAAVRGVVSAAQLLARPAFPHAVHSTVEAAADFHAGHQQRLGQGLGARDFAMTLAGLRERHAAHNRLSLRAYT